jgi:putative peptidoglycan lipid II flippase
MPPSSRNVVRSAGLVVITTILGRITGFGREWMVARLLGSNALTDTYYAAFTLPNLVTYLVAGGALGIILIPVFTQYVTAGKEEESWKVFSIVTTLMSLALFALVMLGELLAGALAHWIAPGFGADQHALLVTLIRILLPSQFFLCLGGILSAVHNAKGRFLVPALAPIVYNFTLISCAWLLHHRFGIVSFALGVTAGTLLGFFGLPLIALRSIGATFRPSLGIQHPGVRQFLKLAVPVMLAVSVDVADVWIVRWFGSYLSSGSITWLMYSRYIAIIPVAIIGQAAGIASYPFLAHLFAEGKYSDFARSIAAGAKSLLLIMLPISALTIVLSRPLVRLAFANTKLTQTDVHSIAAALAILAVGLWAKGAQPIIGRGFSAAHNTLTPALIGTLITLVSLPLYWFCAREWHYLGLAAASSAVSVLFVAGLMVAFFRQTDFQYIRSVSQCFARVAAASLIGALLCQGILRWLELWIPWRTVSGAFVLVSVVAAVGLPVILITARMLGVREVGQYWKKVCPSLPKIPVAARG